MSATQRSKEVDFKTALKDLAEAARELASATSEHWEHTAPQLKGVAAEQLRRAADCLSGQTETSATTARVRERHRGERSESTRQALINAAISLIAAKGYSGASMDEIAAEAGFTKGAIYNQFNSKEDLFVSVISDLVVQHSGTDYRFVVEDAAQIDATVGTKMQLVTLEAMALALRSESFRERVKPLLLTQVNQAAQRIAAERGATKPDERDQETVVGLIGILNVGGVLMSTVLPREEVLRACSHLVERLMARA
jgi:AcrR family transcriptional regulator